MSGVKRPKSHVKNGLRASYGKKEGHIDLWAFFDNACKADANLLISALSHKTFTYRGFDAPMNKSLMQELAERGYDLTTLDLKISKIDPEDEQAVAVNKMLIERMEGRTI